MMQRFPAERSARTIPPKRVSRRRRIAAMACSASVIWGGGALPAAARAEAQSEATVVRDEIIVTARKRAESILEVPVIVTAVQGEKLDRLGATDMLDLPRLVPGLNLARGNLSNGLFVAIRGVGTAAQDFTIDQSVSINIDGLALTQGLAFASGMFDLGQIEVFKGPQSLFYGKASPGGVISLRSADPTDELEVIARAGYEFEGRESRGELIVSGPLTETLEARVAGNYAVGDGYFRNDIGQVPTASGGRDPDYRRLPRSRNFHLRGTLLWKPTDRLSARLKANLVRDKYIAPEAFQLTGCPEGLAVVPPRDRPFTRGEDCKLNRSVVTPFADPAFFDNATVKKNNGVPFNLANQKYGTLELNYDLSPELAITSTTGYYRLRASSLFLPGALGAMAPIAVTNDFRRREISEELRVSSDFSGPLNFTLGALYQEAKSSARVQQTGNQAYGLASISGDGTTVLNTKTYSLFGQVRWDLSERLELAAGARWTDENRTQSPFNNLTQAVTPVAVTRIGSQNVAPEITLTFTPTDDLTVFGAYKMAYKSGGFSAATFPLPNANNSFGDEKVEGGEVGVKTRLFGRQLLLNVAGYYYKYTGLQVGAILPAVAGTLPLVRIINAGAARTYGVDLDAAYRPQNIDGLELNAALNWNNGRYTKLEGIPCWGGQTFDLGCNTFPNSATGLYTAIDLSGTPMIRAPEWQANFGFSYEVPVASNTRLVFSNSNQYASRFVTFLAKNRPNDDNFQDAVLKVDASIALHGPDDRWEVALIGKNITDKVTGGLGTAGNFAGGLFLTQQITGGGTSGDAGLSEAARYSERGRSVWVRLTLRPNL